MKTGLTVDRVICNQSLPSLFLSLSVFFFSSLSLSLFLLPLKSHFILPCFLSRLLCQPNIASLSLTLFSSLLLHLPHCSSHSASFTLSLTIAPSSFQKQQCISEFLPPRISTQFKVCAHKTTQTCRHTETWHLVCLNALPNGSGEQSGEGLNHHS